MLLQLTTKCNEGCTHCMVNDEFACKVTGKKWKGNFIYRSGEFHYLPNPKPKMKGFQGFRYYDRGQE